MYYAVVCYTHLGTVNAYVKIKHLKPHKNLVIVNN